MDAIAAHAAVSKSTLYARFGSKEALFRAVLQRQIGRWSDLNAKLSESAPTEFAPRLRARAATIRRMSEWPEYRQISRLVRTAAISLPELVPYWQEIGSRTFIRFLADDMRASGGEGAAEGTDWSFLAALFLHGFGGWYEAQGTDGPEDGPTVDRFVDKMVGAIMTLAGLPGEDEVGGRP